MEQKLTKAQKIVLTAMFTGLSETEALENANISPGLYQNWLRSDVWKKAFDESMNACRRRAQLLISNYLIVAAAKLVALCDCDNEVVARNSCVAILEMKSLISESEKLPESSGNDKKLSDKKIETIMRVLTERESNVKENV